MAAEINTCPVCGRPVLVKTGRYGKFVGCSWYPNCVWSTSIEMWYNDANCNPDLWRIAFKEREMDYFIPDDDEWGDR